MDAPIAFEGEKGLSLARSAKLDVVLLDLTPPDGSGLDLCRILRQESDVSIIMMTARRAESDRSVGPAIGADDCVTKPFSMPELVARIRAVMRRSSNQTMWGAEDESELWPRDSELRGTSSAR
ncbi:MAG: response regulator transcription factor [Armatimonadota bacterium]